MADESTHPLLLSALARLDEVDHILRPKLLYEIDGEERELPDPFWPEEATDAE